MILLRHARIPDATGLRIVDILVDEHILRITDSISKVNAEMHDLEGAIVLPGAIDAHVHFNDPGFPEREDFLSGTQAAAAGGVTTIVDMPCTSLPPVTCKANLLYKWDAVRPKAMVDYAFWGGIRGNDAPWSGSTLTELWEAGVVGFKLYTISGMETFSAVTYEEIATLFRRFPEFLFAFHAEDPEMIHSASSLLPRPWTWREYAASRPAEAETVAIRRILQAAGKNRIHIVHVGAAEGAREILAARARGLDVTFETCPHYLAFTADDFAELGARMKTAPPVKSASDREFLRTLIADGSLDYVTTDHAGCDWTQGKVKTDFAEVYNGIPGVQTRIPWLLSEFAGKVPWSRLAELLSIAPARRMGLYPRKGALQIGSDADLTIIEPISPTPFDEASLFSRGKFSPFHGQRFTYRVRQTMVRGQVVYDTDDGFLTAPGYGIWQKRG